MKSLGVLGLMWLVVGCGVSYLGDGAGTGGGVNGQGGAAGAQGWGGSAGAWSPCAGLTCGSECNMAACPPSQEACPTIYAPGYCDQNGACTQQQPQCPDPCAGKACGDPCNIHHHCDPAGCPTILYPSYCDGNGQCTLYDASECPADPCAGKACGDSCVPPCPSGQACPTVMGYCGENGACTVAFPVCNGTCEVAGDCPVPSPACGQCPDGSSVCTAASCVNGECAYTTPACPSDPCAGKACGDSCVPPCPSGQACPTVLGYCNDNGACNLAYPVCSTAACSSGGDCPAPPGYCDLCPDGSSVCVAPSCVNGQCANTLPGCPNYSPCAGKACGDACSPCNPADPACVVPARPMYCNANQGCQVGEPVCGDGYGSCASIDDCPVIPYPCRLCGGGGTTPPCGSLTCLGGACLLACSL